jgi:6-phosphogluconolactonase
MADPVDGTPVSPPAEAVDPHLEIKVLPDAADLPHEAAELIVNAAAAKLANIDHMFSLVLSGGSTPKLLYQLLASDPYRCRLNWSKVEVYFGDERCVPPDHPDSNYRMAHEAMLSKLPIPEPNIHRMRGELPPEQAAIEYGQLLKVKFHHGGPDLVLLGMGDDGHTASLFPGTAALDEHHHRCVANHVPQMDTWRITMTYPFLNRAAAVLVLVEGAKKAGRLHEVLEGPRDPKRLPIQGIRPAGKMTWLVDAAAAGMMDDA